MIEIEVKYEAGHSYKENWDVENNVHCPACGKKPVWLNQGEGDYYEGAEYLCIACGTSFTLPTFNKDMNWQKEQRLEAIRREK